MAATSEPTDPRALPSRFEAHLKLTHLLNSVKPIVGPGDSGRFPASPATRVPPVVIDANRLYQDLRGALRNSRRTALVTLANIGAIRLFCARHVVDEFYEHADEWAAKARVERALLMARWNQEYLPLIRVVEVPQGLLTPDEAVRIAHMATSPIKKYRDPDDMPTATLALLLGAYLLSDDNAPLRAVYGPDADLTDHRQWLAVLHSEGDAGVLSEVKESQEQLVGVAVGGVFLALKALWTRVSPFAAVLAGVVAVYGWRHMTPPVRERVAGFLTTALEEHLALVEQCRQASAALLAVTAPIPSWREMSETMSATAVLTRACLHTIARAGRGDRSAGDLAPVLGSLRVPAYEKKIRTVLRSVPALHQHTPGRFQVGRPADELSRNALMPIRETLVGDCPA